MAKSWHTDLYGTRFNARWQSWRNDIQPRRQSVDHYGTIEGVSKTVEQTREGSSDARLLSVRVAATILAPERPGWEFDLGDRLCGRPQTIRRARPDYGPGGRLRPKA